MEKQVNYTEAQVAQIVESYTSGVTVEAIATQFGKSVKSIVAKLAQQKVYKAKDQEKSKRVTKANLVAKISAALAVEGQVFASLEKASYEALETLAAKVVFENE